MPNPTDQESSSSRRGYGGHAGTLRNEITQLLLELDLRPGDPIPSENTLIERLNVSRGSLREALKTLQAQGILEARHGSGTYVSRLSFEGFADGLIFHSRLSGEGAVRTATELADLRQILETELIQRVAMNGASESTLARLEQIVDEMGRRADQDGTLDDLDREFHAKLYAELDLPLMGQLLEAFWMALAWAKPVPSGPVRESDAVERHRAIVEAVASRDASGAAEAMREHFANTQRWISEAGTAGL